jgi:hypothetical protein
LLIVQSFNCGLALFQTYLDQLPRTEVWCVMWVSNLNSHHKRVFVLSAETSHVMSCDPSNWLKRWFSCLLLCVHMLVPELFLSSQCSMLSDRKKERKLIVNEYYTIITCYGLLKISVLFDTRRKLKHFAVKNCIVGNLWCSVYF